MTLRRANLVITVVCALAGGGLVAGRVWAGGPEPLDLGPAVVVPAGDALLPEATARPAPQSQTTPRSSVPATSSTTTRPAPSSPSAASPTAEKQGKRSSSPQVGGRPVQTLPPPHSSDEGSSLPDFSEDGDDEEEEEEEDGPEGVWSVGGQDGGGQEGDGQDGGGQDGDGQDGGGQDGDDVGEGD